MHLGFHGAPRYTGDLDIFVRSDPANAKRIMEALDEFGFGSAALEQVLTLSGERDSYYWRTQRGAELDLLLMRKGHRYGFEFKCTDAPRVSKSMHVALQDLGLERIWVVYPGRDRYPMHDRIEALPLRQIYQACAELVAG